MILLIILLVLLRKERTPQSESKRESAHGLDGRHWTRAEVLKHGLFWGVLPVVFIPPFLSTALFFQQVHFAQTAGWSHTAFVALFPFYTISSIVFSLFWGAMVDRFGANRLLAIFLLPVVVGFFIFSQFNGVVAFIFGFIFVGRCRGQCHDSDGVLVGVLRHRTYRRDSLAGANNDGDELCCESSFNRIFY